MLSSLSRVNARRVWFVPQLNVWGAADWAEIEYLAIETVNSVKSILFGSASLGEEYQTVKYADLEDFRGNNLPAVLKNPRVVVRPRSEYSAFIVGDETSDGFRVARQMAAAGPVTVDLLVVEMGD